MIYTITLSPSLDYIMDLNQLSVGMINRSSKETIVPGGKGINVSRMLKTLNVDSIIMSFIGGFTGNKLQEELSKFGLKHDLIKINGDTKINVKVNSLSETAINANGPQIKLEDIDLLIAKLTTLNDNDYLVLAGSVPNCLSETIYADILSKLEDKKINIVVDTTNKYLINTLKYHPFLIKPNIEELEEIFNEKLDDINKIKCKCQYLQRLGAKNIIVSLGKEGAVMLCENQEFLVQKSFDGTVVNTIGAGDSLVAGFIYQFELNHSYADALEFGCLCGAATAFSQGLANLDESKKIKNKITPISQK